MLIKVLGWVLRIGFVAFLIWFAFAMIGLFVAFLQIARKTAAEPW